MKISIYLVALSSIMNANIAFGQNQSFQDKVLGRFGPVKLGLLAITDRSTDAEYTMIHGDFQNAKYTRIVDTGGFMLIDSLIAEKFCSDLEAAIPLAGIEGSRNLWTGKGYEIGTSGLVKEIRIVSNTGMQHCYITTSQAKDMIYTIRKNKHLIVPRL